MNILDLKSVFNQNWSLFKINLKEFTSKQSIIVNKYEPEETLKIRNLGCKNFVSMFDRYTLHCIEEIAETKEAMINFNSNKEEALYEIIDILLYLGSMQYIINMNCEDYNVNVEKEYDLNYYNDIMNDTRYEDILLDTMELIIKQRRIWPHRKWHKSYNEFSSIDIAVSLEEMKRLNTLCITYIISLFLKETNNDFVLLNNMVNAKEKVVIDLPMPNLKERE